MVSLEREKRYSEFDVVGKFKKFRLTLSTPTIIRRHIRMVMQRLTARMILTTLDGSQSKTIVLKSTLATNITIRDVMARMIPTIPDIREPVLSDWHLQQVDTKGRAMVY